MHYIPKWSCHVGSWVSQPGTYGRSQGGRYSSHLGVVRVYLEFTAMGGGGWGETYQRVQIEKRARGQDLGAQGDLEVKPSQARNKEQEVRLKEN